MSLAKVEEGSFQLSGVITFDNSPVIAEKGEQLLLNDGQKRWEVDLRSVQKADSSALSVLLSWMRLAQSHKKEICFLNIPAELSALASVCGLHDVISSVTCPVK